MTVCAAESLFNSSNSVAMARDAINSAEPLVDAVGKNHQFLCANVGMDDGLSEPLSAFQHAQDTPAAIQPEVGCDLRLLEVQIHQQNRILGLSCNT